MPTGYTESIGRGVSFEEFVWRCARGFGAFVMMRDDPGDAKMPLSFEPSDYHTKKIAEAQGRLAILKAMTPDQWQAEADKEYDKACSECQEHIIKDADLRSKYNAMLTKVKLWQPPTAEHARLREFMIEQIESSIKFDCGDSSYYKDRCKKLSGPEWYEKQTNQALHDIEYHTREHTEEVNRTGGRNTWIAKLNESVPIPASMTAENLMENVGCEK